MKAVFFLFRKDFREIMRGKKNIVFSITLLIIGVMVLSTTLFFPSLISALSEKAPDMISDSTSLNEMMRNLFPNDVKGSMGIWASDVGVFYTIVITLMTHNLISDEIKKGIWIMPTAVGYEKKKLLLSKCIIYAVSAAFPVFVLTIVYYFAASFLLTERTLSGFPLKATLVLSIAVAGVVALTILLSTLTKHSVSSAITMIGVVLVVPDVLSLFKFGKYLPTYLFTFAYTMSNEIKDIIIPIVGLALLCLVMFYLSSRRLMKMEISR